MSLSPYPTFFRFIDTIGPDGLEVHCEPWHVIGETEKCFYLADDYVWGLYRGPKYSWTGGEIKRRRKRILKDCDYAAKRWAYTDKAQALRAYKARKEWQVRHATLSLERAKAALGFFGDIGIDSRVPEAAKTVIPNDYIQSLGWGDY